MTNSKGTARMPPWRCRVCPGAMPVIQSIFLEPVIAVRVLLPVREWQGGLPARGVNSYLTLSPTNSKRLALLRRQLAVWRADNGLQTVGMAVRGKQARQTPASRVRAVPSGETVRSIVRRAGT